VHPDAEARDDAKLSLIFRPFPRYRREHRIDRSQNPVSTDRFVPVPQRDQAVAFIEIDLATIVGNRLGDVEEELADKGFYLNGTKPFGEPGRVVDIKKQQDFLFDDRAVIGADHQVKQRVDADEVDSPHNHDTDHRKRDDQRHCERQPPIDSRQRIQLPCKQMRQVNG